MTWRALLRGDPLPWRLEKRDPRAPYADRMPSKVDASKWVTLRVLGILKNAFPEAEAS